MLVLDGGAHMQHIKPLIKAQHIHGLRIVVVLVMFLFILQITEQKHGLTALAKCWNDMFIGHQL